MDCTICHGRKEFFHCEFAGGEIVDQYWEPCYHCNGTGVEPPDLDELTLTDDQQRRQLARDDAAPADSAPNVARLYR